MHRSRITNHYHHRIKQARCPLRISLTITASHLVALLPRLAWPRLHSATGVVRCRYPAFHGVQYAQPMKSQDWMTCLLREANMFPRIRMLRKRVAALCQLLAKFWVLYSKEATKILNLRILAIRPMDLPGRSLALQACRSTMDWNWVKYKKRPAFVKPIVLHRLPPMLVALCLTLSPAMLSTIFF